MRSWLNWLKEITEGDGLFIGNLNDVRGLLLIPCIQEVYKNTCIMVLVCVNTNTIMYLYQDFQVNVIDASIVYTNYILWIVLAFITYKIHFHFPMRKPLHDFHP
jgi:hypothetical protein